MRILHYMAGPCNGGVASLVYDLCVLYRKNGHDVDILSSRTKDKYFQSTQKYDDIGINILRHPSDRNYIKNIIHLKNIIRKYDIVHVHLFPHQLLAAIAYRLLPPKDRPILITTEHNTWNNRRKYPLLKHIDRWFYKQYDQIISISPQTEVNLKKWIDDNHINAKIKTILNGIDIDRLKNAENKLHEVIETTPDTKYVVMVARMTHPKDPVTIVKALKECTQNIHAVFVGNGVLESDINETASKLGISNRIHLLGDRYNVPELLKGCHLGILSTHWDGFGLVAAEYMASGIPVLACDVDGLRDVVGNNDLLFKVGDYKTLSEKINHLLSDNTAYNDAIQYCKLQVEHFSAERMAQDYLTTYLNFYIKKQ